MRTPIRRDQTISGIVQHTQIGSYAAAETILDRLAGLSAAETTVALLQRLNTAKPGRCPCCGYRATWGEERLKPNYQTLMEWLPGDPED